MSRVGDGIFCQRALFKLLQNFPSDDDDIIVEIEGKKILEAIWVDAIRPHYHAIDDIGERAATEKISIPRGL
jgi:hypothetical protein